MGKFSVIAGMGHCGTMWLSKVLDAGTDARWHHELRGQLVAGTWLETMRRGPKALLFDRYWRTIERQLEDSDVGDANSWAPVLLPQADEIVPVDHVIYLRRNSIQQLHSLTARSPVWGSKEWLPIVDGYLQVLKLYSSHAARRWEYWSRWEKLCLLVAANDFMPDWLRNAGLPVEVYNLEDLTTDVDLLLTLAPNLSRDEARRWQKRDVNRKVYGPRDPATLWGKWTDEQRDGFRRVVGAVTEIEIGEPA